MNFNLHGWRVLFPAMVIIILLYISCTENPTDTTTPNSSINGVLIDEQGTPIPNAILEVFNPFPSIQSFIAKDTSDEDGNFSFNNIKDDIAALQIKITHKDFKTTEMNLKNFKTASANPIELLHLDSCQGFLKIFTNNAKDSTNLSDVEIRLFRDNTLIRKALTKNGEITLYHICPGNYTLRLFKNGYKLEYQTLEFGETDSILKHFYLLSNADDSCCHGQIMLSLKDSSTGNSISHAAASLYQGNLNLGTMYSDSNGIVVFHGLCEGDYNIAISKSGYSTKGFHDIHLNCNDSLSETKILAKQHGIDTCCTAAIITQVLDTTNSLPITGATVYIFKSGGQTITGTTDQQGNFSAYGLCAPGYYTVKAIKDGYTFSYHPITLTKCDTINLKLFLHKSSKDSCCNGLISITVKDSLSGMPIHGVLTYLHLGNSKIGSGYSDTNGVVYFKGLCPGSYNINFSKAGYNANNLMNIKLECNDTLTHELLLQKNSGHGGDTCCTAAIITQVVDSTNSAPIHGATVYIVSSGGKTITGTTDQNGNFSAYGLCAPGYYTVKAAKDGYSYLYHSITLTKCDTLNVKLSLLKNHADSCCTAAIRTLVLDSSSSQPINEAKVYIMKTGGQTITGSTNRDGLFTAYNLCAPGTYTVKAIKDGYTYSHKTVKFTKCDSTDISLSLLRNVIDSCCHGKIYVTVKDSVTGQPIHGISSYLFKGNSKIKSVYTDSLGRAIFTGLCEGDYSIQFTKTGYLTKVLYNLTLGCNDSIITNFNLPKADSCCTAELEISVYDSTNHNPIPYASVLIFKDNQKIADDTTDAHGNFYIGHLCAPGKYTIKALKEGYRHSYVYVVYTICEKKKQYIGLNK